MARIRTLKPEFWADEKLSLLDPTTRLVFLGLVSMADDAGRLVDNVKLLDGMLFPSTDDSCRDSLDTLARMGRVIRYRSSSGQSLIQVANWQKHQRVDNPSKYVLPGPETAIAIVSLESREDGAKVSRSDLGPTTPDLRPTTAHDEERVLAHYVATHPRRRVGDKDRKLVRRHLVAGMSADLLCDAITGNKGDQWHAAKRKHELSYVLRDEGKISEFAEKAHALAEAVKAGDYWGNPALQAVVGGAS